MFALLSLHALGESLRHPDEGAEFYQPNPYAGPSSTLFMAPLPCAEDIQDDDPIYGASIRSVLPDSYTLDGTIELWDLPPCHEVAGHLSKLRCTPPHYPADIWCKLLGAEDGLPTAFALTTESDSGGEVPNILQV